MIYSLMLSTCFLILLIRGCIAAGKKQQDVIPDEVTLRNQRRGYIQALADNDPCSAGMWLFMDENEKNAAEQQCKNAHEAFLGLPTDEQEACYKAKSPGCQPLSKCEGLMYHCAFVCDTTTYHWETNPKTGKDVQVIEPSEEIKHIKVIYKEILDRIEARRLKHSRYNKDGEGNKSIGRKRKTAELILYPEKRGC